MEILVSAIITTHKREPEIVLRAARSVLNQTFRDLELIVVDDSPDSFALRAQVCDAVRSLGSNVRYLPHEKNMGACAARNTGLSAARGRYVAFLDDDDEWKPEKIEKQFRLFTDDQVSLVYCGSVSRNDCTGTEELRRPSGFSGHVFDKLILENFIGSTSFPLIRRDHMEEVGGFDPLMRSAQDYDVWLRLAARRRVAYVDEPLVVYHVHGGERISTSPASRIQGQERIIAKNATYLAKNRKAWWIRHIKLAPEYASDRQLGAALWLWLRAVCRCPLQVVFNLKILAKVLLAYVAALRK